MKKFKGIKPHEPYKPPSKAIFWTLAGIMILSTLGFIIGNTNNATSAITYNGYTIEATTTGLLVTIEGQLIPFTYYPDSLLALKPSDEIVNLLKNNRVLVVTYNPAEERPELFGGAQYTLEKQLPEKFIIRALTNASGYPLPELSCANATPLAPVLYYVSGNSTGYRYTNGCIIGEAVIAEDITRLQDALAYSTYGILS